MRVSTTRSKNAESFYITKSYINDKGKSTSKIIRKLGTLAELSEKLGTDRDGVMEWAKDQARMETDRYKKDNDSKTVLIPFHSDRQMDYHKKKCFFGGYSPSTTASGLTRHAGRSGQNTNLNTT